MPGAVRAPVLRRADGRAKPHAMSDAPAPRPPLDLDRQKGPLLHQFGDPHLHVGSIQPEVVAQVASGADAMSSSRKSQQFPMRIRLIRCRQVQYLARQRPFRQIAK